MAIIRQYDPFKEMEELLDGFWGGSFAQGLSPAQTALDTPVADVYTAGTKDKKQLVVEAHLPGFNEDDIEINVHEGALEIRATHSEQTERQDKKRQYVLRESATSFYRRIGMPQNVNTDDISADFTNGVLKIKVPFKQLPQPKQVKIGGRKK